MGKSRIGTHSAKKMTTVDAHHSVITMLPCHNGDDQQKFLEECGIGCKVSGGHCYEMKRLQVQQSNGVYCVEDKEFGKL